jgi:hypothetical protein
MEGLRAYRLLQVPMRLDDPRWRRSWRQKPCLVYHVSEGRARGAAARVIAVEGVGVFTGFPWDDPALVMCEARQIAAEMRATAHFGAVRDLGGDPISRAEHEPSSAAAR